MVNKYSEHNLFETDLSNQEVGKLLSPFQRRLLQKSLEKKLRPEYRRRIEIMLMADLGHSQTEICTALNCSHETARYWMFMARTGQAHQWQTLPVGRPKTIDENYLTRLQHLVSQSPREFGYAFSRWTAQWLSKHLEKELGLQVSDRHINRLLKQMGLSTRYKQLKKQTNDEENQVDSSKIKIGNLSANHSSQSFTFSPFSPFQDY
ncbi:helix-turn-helix domain-containing protein [Stanieria cyanosphaera]|nr:helix-turn-helix domain-containing protein [Stanieria cyanosphaera]